MHPRRNRVRGTIGAVLFAVLAASPLAGQSASEVVGQMIAEYERRANGVDDYTLVQQVMGFETSTYFEKEMVDGRPVFQVRSVGAGEMQMGETPDASMDQLYAMGEELARRAEHGGREEIGGSNTHILILDDLSGLGLDDAVAADSEFEPTGGRLYIDPDSYAPLRMEFDGEMTNDQGTHSVKSTMDLQDYREVEGLLIPYRTVITIEGLGAAIDPEARAQFEEMQRELENMPEAQRRMVESMMADQLEQFQAMMEGGDAPMVMEIVVSEVRVNTGPPGR